MQKHDYGWIAVLHLYVFLHLKISSYLFVDLFLRQIHCEISSLARWEDTVQEQYRFWRLGSLFHNFFQLVYGLDALSVGLQNDESLTNTGFQYTPVLSIATCVTPFAISHSFSSVKELLKCFHVKAESLVTVVNDFVP